jgi:hypothetical protein
MAELFDILAHHHEIVEAVDITTTDPDWTDLITLLTPDLDAGVFGLVFSLQFNMDSTNRSFMYRFSNDGGATWSDIYEHESKDKSNTDIIEVFDLINHPGGVLDLRCQVTRESDADCVVRKAIISVDRKA